MDYGKEIAKSALNIGAINLNTDKPFVWASGYQNPIYNDNRLHLAYPENRAIITAGLIDIIKNNDIQFDMVAGTMTAGVAPATSLAQSLDKPLAIVNKGQLYVFEPNFFDDLVDAVDPVKYGTVVSTCPFGIIPGVAAANYNSMPFAYVREKAKGHGMMQQIESRINPGERVLLADYFIGDSYSHSAKRAIEEKGAIVNALVKHDISDRFNRDKIKGVKLLQVEDLISTAGSCVKEIQTYRNQFGAQVSNCIAIFSYGFPDSLAKFEEANCSVNAVLEYPTILKAAIEGRYINSDQEQMLASWNSDWKSWGEKNGFPRIKK